MRHETHGTHGGREMAQPGRVQTMKHLPCKHQGLGSILSATCAHNLIPGKVKTGESWACWPDSVAESKLLQV